MAEAFTGFSPGGIAVGQRLRDGTGRDVCFEPTVGKSLFQINRDTRFSADKTPYHPWVDATWGEDSPTTCCAATACTPQSSGPTRRRWPHHSSPTPSPAFSRPSRSTAGWSTTSRPDLSASWRYLDTVLSRPVF
jgi:hypothetical protein